MKPRPLLAQPTMKRESFTEMCTQKNSKLFKKNYGANRHSHISSLGQDEVVVTRDTINTSSRKIPVLSGILKNKTPIAFKKKKKKKSDTVSKNKHTSVIIDFHQPYLLPVPIPDFGWRMGSFLFAQFWCTTFPSPPLCRTCMAVTTWILFPVCFLFEWQRLHFIGRVRLASGLA